jgi:hypothetical protein
LSHNEWAGFPSVDVGWGEVTAAGSLVVGDVIEAVPTLALSVATTVGTVLAAVVIKWADVGTVNMMTLVAVRKAGGLTIQRQGVDTEWKRVDTFDDYSWADIGLIPHGRRARFLTLQSIFVCPP